MKSRYAFDNKFTSELQSKSKNWCKLKTLLYGVSIANCDAYLNNVSVLAIKLCNVFQRQEGLHQTKVVLLLMELYV